MPTVVESDDVLNEDFAAEGFSAKLGRWSREVLNEITKDLFWGLMFIAHTCRGPVDTLQNWLRIHWNISLRHSNRPLSFKRSISKLKIVDIQTRP